MKSDLQRAITAFGTNYGDPTPPPQTSTTVGVRSHDLPFTGADTTDTAAIGVGLLVLGVLLAGVAFKRRGR